MRLGQKKSNPWSGIYMGTAFFIPFVGMLVVMASSAIAPFGGRSMLYSDSYHQYYPFFLSFRRTLLEGKSLLYNWDIGMGVDYLGMIAYYLASPLNLLSVLVPEGQLLNFFSLLVPLRLGFAGLFFALFLRGVFGREDFSVALFGSFYAVCAWALGYQWNVMWMDTFALLPLVMLGMVRMLRERSFLLYAITLALSVMSNYYIGLFTCFFVFLSFFCFEICEWKSWRHFFADLWTIGVFSLLALGMTAVLTVSAMAALQTTQSSVNSFPTGFRLNIAPSHNFRGLLTGMRRVAGNMGGSLEPSFKEGLPNLYCGVGSILLGFLFLMDDGTKLRDKLCGLFLVLFFNLSFLIRQLDYIWHGFHFPNMIPYRFSFLHSFVLLFMAYRAWLHRKRFDLLQIFAAMFLTAAVLCSSDALFSTRSFTLWGRALSVHVYIIYNAVFLVLFTLVLCYGALQPRLREATAEEQLRVRRIRRLRWRDSATAVRTVMLLEVIAALISFATWFPATDMTGYPRGGEAAASMIRYMHEREEDNGFFRAEVDHAQTLNDGALNGYSGISTFTSSANVHITEFLRALGYGAKNTYNRYCFEESSPVANLFLDLKYMLNREGKDISSTYFREVHHYGSTALYENTAYLPLGFLADPALAQLDFIQSNGNFFFQNQLFRAATGIPSDVWHTIEQEYLDVCGTGVDVSSVSSNGYVSYSKPVSGASVIYSFVANRDGFACVLLELPKRNDFYVSVNGFELYRENYSIPQMLAVKDVKAGDVIDVRILCKAEEDGTATVSMAILDDAIFQAGYQRLKESTMTLTRFEDTLVEAAMDCSRDGLLYTSIPQNGNWQAFVDGKEAEITLIGNCMIGLNLTAGHHSLRFVYRNQAFLLGSAITLLSTTALLGAAVVRYRPSRKKAGKIEE